MSIWCARIVGADGTVLHRARIDVDSMGNVEGVQEDCDPTDDDLRLGTVLPGTGNAHSHAFHRLLRGRTHGDGGDFWQWRDKMYELAATLTPDNYYTLARAVFAEMVVCGYTSVGEFHYVHHRVDGGSYPHAMEEAVVAAADSVGIRLRLLDTAYLHGGIGIALSSQQLRFGDASAGAYLERWHSLRERVGTLGAAIHSVRAVTPDEIRTIVDGLPPDVPLHVHLSEQPRENQEALDAYGRTPTGLLADSGALAPRLSVVHATHLRDDDVITLGEAKVSVVMCPTTEGDLGDGIGPARSLHDAGAELSLGSDQNAVVDPFLEMRGLEIHERLASRRRGRFEPAALIHAASAGGYRSLGWGVPLALGGPCDLVEVDAESIRTSGSDIHQLALTATAADVTRVVVAGQTVAVGGLLANREDPAELMRVAFEQIGLQRSR